MGWHFTPLSTPVAEGVTATPFDTQDRCKNRSIALSNHSIY